MDGWRLNINFQGMKDKRWKRVWEEGGWVEEKGKLIGDQGDRFYGGITYSSGKIIKMT